MKNKTKKALCAASILGVVAISGIYAYLTDHESKENVFTFGNVNIELHEPGWEITDENKSTVDKNDNDIPDIAENVVPNQVIPKAPTVENVGANDAYVFVRIQVPTVNDPATDVMQAVDDWGLQLEEPPIEYINLIGLDDENWLTIQTYEGKEGLGTYPGPVNEYILCYKGILEPGAETGAIFTGIQIANITEEEIMTSRVHVTAFAIQADGLPAEITEAIAGLKEIEDPVDREEETVSIMSDVFDIIMNQQPTLQTRYIENM